VTAPAGDESDGGDPIRAAGDSIATALAQPLARADDTLLIDA